MNKHFFELVRELAINEFKLKYKNSALGYVWSLVKPLALFLVLYLVFSVFLRIAGGMEYYQFYLLLGIIIWIFFADTTMICMHSIVAKGHLIKKVKIPKIAIILSASCVTFITFIIDLAVFFILGLIFHLPFQINLIYLPLYILELYLLALGIAFILSTAYVWFRDLDHIWQIILQIGFYITPIIYPMSVLPAKYHFYVLINPLAQIMQSMRSSAIQSDIVQAPMIWLNLLIVLWIFTIGILIFNKKSKYFAEYI
ncbi:hypothetical protein CL633_00240 [bacterium]|nr:hypothetical protein [bacterium]|tara:strand:- start:4739 stop:5503 length:765 start_codon:yes stop_codon:yes gene_type:complete